MTAASALYRMKHRIVLPGSKFYLGVEHETKQRVQHRPTDDEFKQPIIEIEDGVTR